jgi:hypothetical protein
MCFGSRDKGDESGVARSRELDKVIRADEKRMAKEVKLLLLGANIHSSARPAVSSAELTWLGANCRCWRVWKVDSAEADEVDLRPRVQQE